MIAAHAIFLSYASEDADAARRICDALRAAGLEVWFDQSELRGGDAWDQSIRKQIRECTLFVPVISANTQARPEGYFRLEWRLADQRTHLMAKGMAFILPVAIDGVSEAGALVPDSFVEVQWTKVGNESSAAAFAAWAAKLIAGSGSPAIMVSNTAPNNEFAERGNAKVTTTPRAGLTGENWVAIFAVVFGIGSGVWFMANRQAQSEKKSAPSAAPVAAFPADSATAVNPLSVMVMPFANQTGDKDKAYIADALTSSIASDLSRIRDATIVPAATAFSLRDKQLTIPQLGKEAAVRFVLTGNVTGDKEKLRINAVLSDTQTGAQMWAENFDGSPTNLFALQDQLTTRIGNSIDRQVVIAAARESEKRASTPQVADLLMRARALWLEQQSPKNYAEREALYRQVLTLDPNNLSAKAGLASILGLKAVNYATVLKLDDAGRVALAKQAFDLAEEVKAIEPNNPDIYLPLSIYFGEIGDFPAAIQAGLRRIELQPKSSAAYSSLCAMKRRIDDIAGAKAACATAIEYATRARPSAEAYFNLAHIAFRENKLDESIAWAQKGADLVPNVSSPYLAKALAFAGKGNVEQAKQLAAEATRRDAELRLKNQWIHRRPWPGKEAEFKKFMDTQFIPAWRAAGLPE